MLGYLCRPLRRVLLQAQYGTASLDALYWIRVLDTAPEHLALVEEASWGVLHFCRGDEIGSVDEGVTTERAKIGSIKGGIENILQPNEESNIFSGLV